MKPFGWSLLLDFYDCDVGVLDSLEDNYRYLERLCDLLGMHKFFGPVVNHGPTNNGIEIYPGKAGVSGVLFLIESSIVIHTILPEKFASVDVYSCGAMNTEGVINYSRDVFKFKDYESQLVIRGKEYGRIKTI